VEGLPIRLINRRAALGLTQGEVAQQIRFLNERQRKWATLSRSAYCMYETGAVTPDLAKLVEIAKVLRCSPEWLAFGGEYVVNLPSVIWDSSVENWTEVDRFNVDPGMIATITDAAVSKLVLFQGLGCTDTPTRSEMLVVSLGDRPSTGARQYVYAYDGQIRAGHVTVLHDGRLLRLWDHGARPVDVDPDQVNVLGRIHGRMMQGL
jgi:transcriptional regulator with XRE-family HTH domain